MNGIIVTIDIVQFAQVTSPGQTFSALSVNPKTPPKKIYYE